MMPFIQFEKLWIHYNGAIRLQIYASGENFSSYLDVFIYPEDLKKFSQALQSFPQKPYDEIIFELGSKESFYLKIKNYIDDKFGGIQLKTFSQTLTNTPLKINDKVIIDIPAENKKRLKHRTYHLKIRAFLIDRAGHSAFEIITDNKDVAPSIMKSHFFIKCNPADINSLGLKLENWIFTETDILKFEWIK